MSGRRSGSAGGREPVGRRRAVVALVTVVAVIGLGVLAWALPRAWDFLHSAPPAAFWATSLMALVGEGPLLALAGIRGGQARATLSICFTFAILLLWSAGMAIVVQVLAAVIRSLSLRLTPWQGVFLTGRLVCALGAVAAVRSAVRHGPLGAPEAASLLLLLSLLLCLVAFGPLVLGLAVAGLGGARAAIAAVEENLLGTGALLLLVFPALLGLADRGWWIALLLVPLLVWNQLARRSLSRQDWLRREPVSGALNRRGLADSFDALAAADMIDPRREHPFGIVMVNLGAAEAISRDLGRAIHDDLTAAAARRLVDAYGPEYVGRFAGESFVVLRPDLSADQADEQGQRVVEILTPQIEVDGIPFSLLPVAGVALAPRREHDLDNLVDQADLAAGQARRSGRSTQLYVPRAEAQTRRRRELLATLHETLRDSPDEITVLYQPQIELATGRLESVEALMRWTHPRLGVVRPDELIPAIESSEVMHRLTAHIIERVTAQLAAWNRDGLRIRAALNVSVNDMSHEGLAGLVVTALRRCHVPPPQLTIEVTEGALVTDAELVVRAAEAIAGLGIGLSLDDFGTGYASLRQLRQLPLTEVKIDQSYVKGMTTDPTQRRLVEGIHDFARTLHLSVVAEGVEDAPTAAALAGLSGVLGQGFYFGHPMPPAELVERYR